MSTQPTPTRTRCQDLTGKTFGRWTVIGFAEMSAHRESRWKCRCECGTERVVWRTALIGGSSRSCGCSNRPEFLIAKAIPALTDVGVEMLAWAAGFFDGEGSITLRKQSRRSVSLVINVSNKNLNGLQRLHSHFGGRITCDKRSGGCYCWTASDRVAEQFLRSVRPYLAQKDTVADLAFRFRETIGGKGHRTSDEVFALRHRLRAEIMEINAKD